MQFDEFLSVLDLLQNPDKYASKIAELTQREESIKLSIEHINSRIDAAYLNPNTYQEIINITVGPEDFSQTQYKICPGADPTAISQTEKLIKAQGLHEMLSLGILDPVKVGLRMLEAQEQPNIQDLLLPQVAQTGQMPQQPNPKVEESNAKIQAIQQASAIKQQELAFKQQMDQRDQQFKEAMAASSADHEARSKGMLAQLNAAIQTHTANMQVAQDKQKFMQSVQQSQVEHQQKVVQKHVDHAQKVQHTQEMGHVQRQQAAKQKPASKGK